MKKFLLPLIFALSGIVFAATLSDAHPRRVACVRPHPVIIVKPAPVIVTKHGVVIHRGWKVVNGVRVNGYWEWRGPAVGWTWRPAL